MDNNKLKLVWKTVNWVVLFAFTTTTLWATPVDLNSLNVKKELGKVKEVSVSKDKQKPSVILIQDAHNSLEAQKNLSQIIQDLNNNYDIDMIGVEGAFNSVNYEELQKFPVKEVKETISSYYLKKGYLTGAEYGSIVSDKKIDLRGIENENEFKESYKSFLKIKSHGHKLLNFIASYNNFSSDLSSKVFNSQLKQLDKVIQVFEAGNTSPLIFVEQIQKQLTKNDINIEMGESTQNLFTLLKDIEQVDVNALNKEVEYLVDNGIVEKTSLPSLDKFAALYEATLIAQSAFAAEVVSLVADKNSADQTPNLLALNNFFNQYEKIDFSSVDSELGVYIQQARLALSSSDLEREVINNEFAIQKLERLAALQALPADVSHFFANPKDFDLDYLILFAKSQGKQFSIHFQLSEKDSELKSLLKEAARFYRLANKRDIIFVQNVLKQLAQKREKSAIIVTGGYHTKGIVKELKKKNISYAVITPNINQAEIEVPYLSRLTGKLIPVEAVQVNYFTGLLPAISTTAQRILGDRMSSQFALEATRSGTITGLTSANTGLTGDELSAIQSVSTRLNEDPLLRARLRTGASVETVVEELLPQVGDMTRGSALEAGLKRVISNVIDGLTQRELIKAASLGTEGVDDDPELSTSRESAITRLKDAISNEAVVQSILDAAREYGFDLSQVEVITGKKEQRQRLLEEGVERNEVIALKGSQEGNYLLKANPKDTVRDPNRTFVVNSTDNHKEHSKVERLLKSAMAGKKVYVVPGLLGPPRSPYARVGFQITTSRKTVLNEDNLYAIGQVALDHLGGSTDFDMGIHAPGDIDAIFEQIDDTGENDQTFVLLKDKKLALSYGSDYGGNAILFKKFMGLRLSQYQTVVNGDGTQEAAHMGLIERTNKTTGEKRYYAYAAPTASGKTNFVMMQSEDANVQFRIISDDIIWARAEDGEMRAIPIEAGMFGVISGTNESETPKAVRAIAANTGTIYAYTAYNPLTGEVWWPGKTKDLPTDEGWLTYRGVPALGKDKKEWAAPNARYAATLKADRAPEGLTSENWQDPQGVRVDAILLGARRTTGEVLVRELRTPEEAVYDGALMRAEKSIGERSGQGKLVWDSWAMRPFYAVAKALHWEHLLGFFRKMWPSNESARKDKGPRVFHVNWFRKSTTGQYGGYIWPGFSENRRVLDWIDGRLDGEDNFVDTPIGRVPTVDSIDLEGIKTTKEELGELLKVDFEWWKEELKARRQILEDEQERSGEETPVEIWNEQERMEREIARAASLGADDVALTIDEGIASITLNRGKVNATTLEMMNLIDGYLDQIESDESVKLVILKGANGKFSAGADIKLLLKEIEDGNPEAADEFYRVEYALDQRLAAFSKPIITFADGITMGSGAGLAFGSGLIVATERTSFAMPETKIGLFPDVGATYYLPARMGLVRAKYYGYTGEALTGEEAVRTNAADFFTQSSDLESLEAQIKEWVVLKVNITKDMVRELFDDSTLAKRGDDFAPDDFSKKLGLIDSHFYGQNPTEIKAKLEATVARGDESGFAQAVLDTLSERSPQSVFLTDFLLSTHNDYSRKDLARVFENELAIAKLLSRDPEYVEGVRSLLIEKRAPVWPSVVTEGRRFRVPGDAGRTHELGIIASMFRSKTGWDMLEALYDINPNKFELDNARTSLGWMGKEDNKPTKGLNTENAPNVRWFEDGVTNASWEALDRWVEAGLGEKTAFIYEGPEVDQLGEPKVVENITYSQLLDRVQRIANVMKDLGLKKGDGIVFYMPNTVDIYAAQFAAARMGVKYHPVFAGKSKQALSDAISILDAKAVFVVDGIFRNGEANQYLSEKVNPVLDNFLPTEVILERVKIALLAKVSDPSVVDIMLGQITPRISAKLTMDKAKALTIIKEELKWADDSELLASVSNEVNKGFKRVEHVVIKKELNERSDATPRDRDRDWDTLEARASNKFAPVPLPAEHPLFVMLTSGSTGPPKALVHTTGGYLAMLVRNLRDNFGLDQDDRIFTVADPGWITGQSFTGFGPLAYGMTSIVYGGDPSNIWKAVKRHKPHFFKSGVTIYRAAIKGGVEVITDQGILDIPELHEPGKVFCAYCAEPSDSRSIVFVRNNLAGWYDPQTKEVITDIKEATKRLEAGKTLYGSDANMWWPTEQGGPMTSANPMSYPQDKDAKVRQLPWIRHKVFVHRVMVTKEVLANSELSKKLVENLPQGDQLSDYVGEYVDLGKHAYEAAPGESGGWFMQYQPGMVRGTEPRTAEARKEGETFWTDPKFGSVYYSKSGAAEGWHYTGDGAEVYVDDDGKRIYFLLGREDEVINTAGHRIGTISIEGSLRGFRGIGDAAAIGVNDPTKGQRPVVYAILQEGVEPSAELIAAARNQIKDEVHEAGAPAPNDIFFVKAFPTTKSGKYLRRFLKVVASWERERMEKALEWLNENQALIDANDDTVPDSFKESFPETGDLSTLNDFSVVADTIRSVAKSRKVLVEEVKKRIRADVRTASIPIEVPEGATVAKFGDNLSPTAPLPLATEAWAILRAKEDGAPIFAEQEDKVTVAGAFHKIVLPIDPNVGDNEVLAEVLLSGMTHNTLHAVLEDPIDVMAQGDDYHVPGSIAVVRVLRRGTAVEAEKRVEDGELYLAFPAKYNTLGLDVGEDPMHSGYKIEGYEISGLHSKVVRLEGYQLIPLPKDFDLEKAAGISLLDYLTSYKAIRDVLKVRKGDRVFTVGAASGTGDFNNHIASRIGAEVTGLVSSTDRGAYAKSRGATNTVNRKNPKFEGVFTPVPEDPSEWEAWEAAGKPWVEAMTNDDGLKPNKLVDFSGRPMFARIVQAAADGADITFYGAFLGYNQTFIGKDVDSTPEEAFDKADVVLGESVLIYYGMDGDNDSNGLEAIDEAISRGARIAVAARTKAQATFLESKYGNKLVGIITVEDLEGSGSFKWPTQVPDFDVIEDRDERDRTRSRFEEKTLKVFGKAVRDIIGDPDVVVERASQNTLGMSSFIVKKFTGRVVYFENMKGRRYNFYAPTVWMNQRKILTPGFNIISTHLGNPAQAVKLIRDLSNGILEPAQVEILPTADGLPAGYEAQHEGTRVGTTAVNFGTPDLSITNATGHDTALGVKFEKFGTYVTVRWDEVDGGTIARVIFSNGKVNSLKRDAINQLRDAFRKLNADDSVKAIVLIGKGNTAFMAGQDLNQLLRDMTKESDAVELAEKAQSVFNEIEASDKPVITVLNGIALGGGNELALSTHFVIAPPHVSVGQPEIRLNLLPGFAGTQRLVRRAAGISGKNGILRSTQALLTGREIPAIEAQELGIIDEIVPHSALARAYELVREFIESGNTSVLGKAFTKRKISILKANEPLPHDVSVFEDLSITEILASQKLLGREVPATFTLEAIRLGLDQGINAGSALEAKHFGTAVTREDLGRTGIQAFLEKFPNQLPARPTQLISPMGLGRDDVRGLSLGEEINPILGLATDRLKGKVVMISGGHGGLGLIISHRVLAANPEGLVIIGRDPKKIKENVDQMRETFIEAGFKVKILNDVEDNRYAADEEGVIKIITIQGDLKDPKTIEAAMAQTKDTFGRLDVLVNNAGTAGPMDSLPNIAINPGDPDSTGAVKESLVDAFGNLFESAWALTQAATPLMDAGSSVVTISTIFSEVEYYYGRTGYSVLKAALNGLFEQMVQELGDKGIRSNIIQPGLLKTALPTESGVIPRFQAVLNGMGARTALGPVGFGDIIKDEVRLSQTGADGQLESDFINQLDIADTTVFFAADESKATSGQTIQVTNGQDVNTSLDSTNLEVIGNFDLTKLAGKKVLIIGDKMGNSSSAVSTLVTTLSMVGVTPILATLDGEEADFTVDTRNPNSVEKLFESVGDIDSVISFPQFKLPSKPVLELTEEERASFIREHLFSQIVIGKYASALFEFREGDIGNGGTLLFVGPEQITPTTGVVTSMLTQLVRIRRAEVKRDIPRSDKTNKGPLTIYQIVRAIKDVDDSITTLPQGIAAVLSGESQPTALNLRVPQKASAYSLGEEVDPILGKLSDRLEGKVVMITGGHSGLGEIISRRVLAADPKGLVIIGRNPDTLRDNVQKMRDDFAAVGRTVEIITVQGDISNPETIEKAISETNDAFGRLDVLINNAGTAGPMDSLPNIALKKGDPNSAGDPVSEGLQEAFGNLFEGAWALTQAAAPLMQPGSSVVTISTIFSEVDYYYGRTGYSVLKSALNGLFKQMVTELGQQGIRSNIIEPGLLKTAFPPAPGEKPRFERVLDGMGARTGLGPVGFGNIIKDEVRLLQTGEDEQLEADFINQLDIANTAVFLAADESKAVAGQTIQVTNGQAVDTSLDSTSLADTAKIHTLNLSGKKALIIADELGEIGSEVLQLAIDFEGRGMKAVIAVREPSEDQLKVDTSDPASVEKLFTDLEEAGDIDFVVSFPQFKLPTTSVLKMTAEERAAFIRQHLMSQIVVGKFASQYLEKTEEQRGNGGGLLFVGPTEITPTTTTVTEMLKQLVQIRRAEVSRDIGREDKTNAGQLVIYQVVRAVKDANRNSGVLAENISSILSGANRPTALNLRVPQKASAYSLGDEADVPATETSPEAPKDGTKMTDDELLMLKNLHFDRVAIVTGGGSGIGRSIALELARSGAKVVIAARGREKLEKVQAEMDEINKRYGYGEDRVLVVPTDVGKPDRLKNLVDSTVERFGRIDYLLNNAGGSGVEKPVRLADSKAWQNAGNVLVRSAYLLALMVGPHMAKQGYGHILNTGTFFAGEPYQAIAYPKRSDYSTWKAIMAGLARHWVFQFGNDDIRWNTMSPGPVDGDRLRGSAGNPGLFERRARLIVDDKLAYGVVKKITTQKREGKDIDFIVNGLKSDEKINTHIINIVLEILATQDTFSLEAIKNIGEGYGTIERDIYPEDQIKILSGKVESNVMKQLSLKRMPTNDEVGRSAALYLALNAQSGQTLQPSNGQRNAKDAMTTYAWGVLPDSSKRELSGKTVIITGEEQRIKLAAVANGYARNGANVHLLVRTEDSKDAIKSQIKKEYKDRVSITVFDLDSKSDLEIQDKFKSIKTKHGSLDIVISAPQSGISTTDMFNFKAGEEISTGKLNLASDAFDRLGWQQITHHVRLGKIGANVMTDENRGGSFLIWGPETQRATSDETRRVVKLIQTALRQLTVTFAAEELSAFRFGQIPLPVRVNQLYLGSPNKGDDASSEREAQEQLKDFVTAVLLATADTITRDLTKSRREAMTGKVILPHGIRQAVEERSLIEIYKLATTALAEGNLLEAYRGFRRVTDLGKSETDEDIKLRAFDQIAAIRKEGVWKSLQAPLAEGTTVSDVLSRVTQSDGNAREVTVQISATTILENPFNFIVNNEVLSLDKLLIGTRTKLEITTDDNTQIDAVKLALGVNSTNEAFISFKPVSAVGTRDIIIKRDDGNLVIPSNPKLFKNLTLLLPLLIDLGKKEGDFDLASQLNTKIFSLKQGKIVVNRDALEDSASTLRFITNDFRHFRGAKDVLKRIEEETGEVAASSLGSAISTLAVSDEIKVGTIGQRIASALLKNKQISSLVIQLDDPTQLSDSDFSKLLSVLLTEIKKGRSALKEVVLAIEGDVVLTNSFLQAASLEGVLKVAALTSGASSLELGKAIQSAAKRYQGLDHVAVVAGSSSLDNRNFSREAVSDSFLVYSDRLSDQGRAIKNNVLTLAGVTLAVIEKAVAYSGQQIQDSELTVIKGIHLIQEGYANEIDAIVAHIMTEVASALSLGTAA